MGVGAAEAWGTGGEREWVAREVAGFWEGEREKASR